MKISRRDSVTMLIAAAAMAARAGSGRAEEPEIVLGAPNSLTGGFGENGQRGVWGFLIAAEQINREGGIKALGGARLRVVVADTTSDNPTQGASVTRRMLDQDGAVALYGSTASAITMASQVEAEKARVPIITSAYVDAVVARGMKYTFKVTAPGSRLWNFAVDGVTEMVRAHGGAAKTCGIFMGSDAVSMSVSKTLPAEAKRIGLDVLAHVDFQGNLSDPSVIVSPVMQNRPDLIFLSSFLSDAILVLKALRGLGIKTPVVAAGGVSSDAAGKAMGAAGNQVFMPWSWNWDLPVPGVSQLVQLYKQAHPDAPFPPNNEQMGCGYAAGMIFREALEQAASRDPTKLRDVIASTEFTGLAMPETTIAFDENGLNKHAGLVVAEWVDGTTHTVWPKQLQGAEPLF